MIKKSGFLKHGVVLRRMFRDRKCMAKAGGGEDYGGISDEEKKKEAKEARIRAKQAVFAEELREKREKEGGKGIERVSPTEVAKSIAKGIAKGYRKIPETQRQKVTSVVQPIKPAVRWTGKAAKGVFYKAPKYGAGAVLGAKESLEKHTKKAKDFMQGEYGGWMFILMAVFLYMMDMLFRYNGINIQRFLDNLYFTSIESYIGWFFNSIVLTLLIAYYVIYRPDPQEFVSWFLVAETLSLIIFMGGMGTALIHLAFVISFYFLYIRYAAPEGNKASANYIFFFLLAFDFFGFGILAELVGNPIISNRLIIPIWFYFALIYTHEKERSFWINLVIIIVILMNVFYFVGGINGLKSMSATLTQEEKQEGINFIRTGWNNVKDTFSKAIEGFRADLEAQMIYASGGYYKGKVERNKIGPLGVFIDKLKASQPRYYENEDVIIWGTIKALSLGDNVNIKMSCHKKDEEKYATRTTPNVPFTIYSKETRDFECVFDEGKFDSWGDEGSGWFFDLGFHTITADAEFNFETLAYLKSYFMDIERKRSMVREGLDPFKEFGIKYTEPIAVYTDGPVIIGMEMTSPIIEVGEGIVTQPRIGITLENKEGWEGVIRSLTELVILTPHGVRINLEEEPCTYSFKKYTIENCKQDSCENLAFKPCVEVCELNKKKSSTKDCNKECGKVKKSCISDCDILFKGDKEREPYNGYAIDINAEKKKYLLKWDVFKDIDRYRSFSCRLTVSGEGEDNVLGNTPLTVKYFRAKARYNYTLSKDIDIQIQSKPGTAAKVSEKIDIKGDIPNLIVKYAKEIGVPQTYALALAYQESKWRHCCKDIGLNRNSECTATGDPSCGPDYILESYDGSSLGIMQLNKNKHSTWFISNDGCGGYYSQLDEDCLVKSDAGCIGKTAYDIDCNIKIGLAYLKKLKETYGLGCKESSVYAKAKKNPNEYPTFLKGCEECWVCKKSTPTDIGLDLCTEKKHFYEYKNWDAALRGYVGWGCDDKHKNYVEDVLEIKKKIENGELTVKGLDIAESTEFLENPWNVMTDVELGDVYLTWERSKSSDVDYYEIWRENIEGTKTEFNQIGEVDSTIFEFLDGNCYYGKSYSYYIRAKNNQGKYSAFVKSDKVECRYTGDPITI